MDKLRVKPADPDAIVRDSESGKILPAEGAPVDNNTYWRRRLRDGSVVLAKAEPKAPASSLTPKPKGKPAAKKED